MEESFSSKETIAKTSTMYCGTIHNLFPIDYHINAKILPQLLLVESVLTEKKMKNTNKINIILKSTVSSLHSESKTQ